MTEPLAVLFLLIPLCRIVCLCCSLWYQAFACLDLAIGCHVFELFGLSVNLWIFPLVLSLLCCNWVHTLLHLYLIPNVTYM